MNDASATGYRHTQKGPWYLLVGGFGILMIAVGVMVQEPPFLPWIMIPAGSLMLLVSVCFQHLTVQDQGDRLDIRFGPVKLFGTSVRYEDLEHVEIGRTILIEGWGIHGSPRGGWVWNIWGWECVVLHRRKGSVLRIGTDDANNLARFLESKLPHPTPTPAPLAAGPTHEPGRH